MATELAQAYVQILPSMKGIKQNLTDEMNPAAESAGKSAGSRLGSLIKRAIAAAGIGAALKSALSEGAALEQSIGGVETLFKDSASIVKQYAADAYKTAGLSANAYMEQVTSFSASLLQSLGGDTSAAAEVAHMAMVDMSDNANKMGTDMQSIQNAYQGFAKQNYTMLDNLKLGYGGTKEEMQRLLKDAQAITGVKYDISNLSDVYNAIHVIQGQLDITGTTAKEAATTFSGSLGAMKAAAQNLMANMMLGNDLAPALSAMKDTVITFVGGNLLPALQRIFAAVPQVLVELIATIAPQLVTLITDTMQSLTQTIAAQMPTLIPVFTQGVTDIIAALVAALPGLIDCGTQLLLALVGGITAAIPVLTAAIPQIISALVGAIPQIINAAVQLFMAIVDAIPTIITALIDSLPEIITTIIKTLIEAIPQLIQGAIQFFMALIQALPTIIQALIAALPQIVTTTVRVLLENLPLLIQGAVQLFMGIITAIPQIVVELVKALPQIVIAIVNGLAAGIGKVAEVGSQLVRGLWNGIKNVTGWVIDKIKGFGRSIMNGIKSIFGIHSPSREMAWVGEMLDYGLAEGISDNTRPISDAIDDVTDMTTRSFENDLAVNAALGVSSDADANGLLGQLLAAVQNLEQRLDNMQIYLDSGELVGGIAPKMDAALGRRGGLTVRGVTV